MLICFVVMLYIREDLESIPIPNTDELLSIHDGSEIKGIIISVKSGGCDSEGQPYDFISRYFAAWNGIPEDPVTGMCPHFYFGLVINTLAMIML